MKLAPVKSGAPPSVRTDERRRRRHADAMPHAKMLRREPGGPTRPLETLMPRWMLALFITALILSLVGTVAIVLRTDFSGRPPGKAGVEGTGAVPGPGTGR